MRYFIIACIAAFCCSCQKDELIDYSGGDGIAFYVGEYEIDSVSYSFAFSPAPIDKDTIYLKMRVVGGAKDYPRTIAVKAGPGTTARPEVDFILPQHTLPAGALTVDYPVIVMNTPEMADNEFRLVAEVTESKDFSPGAVGQEIGGSYNLPKILVKITNKIVEPTYWPDVESAFGPFSAAKFRFMIQATGLTDFSYEALGTSGIYNLPVRLRNALLEYEAANGPLIDENGNRVTF